MATVRSVDFLPQIFQTDANKQFLSATLDQLVQEPQFKKTQGFIGRRVGPGVDPNDNYVIEPNATRANYQLEPGIISLLPDTNTIKNAITYPGINDAVAFQGGNSLRPDLLYSSDYYTWDPFIDYDSFVNFAQYYWLPNGPDAVNVSNSEGYAVSQNFVVTRENGVYTFSGVSGENPLITLVRGGSYTFQVAQNKKETVNFRVRNQGVTAYVIDYQNNPTLTLARGNTYVFNLSLNGVFPFWIKTLPSLGVGDAYNQGVDRNGSTTGLITFVVPQDAPDTLYYTSQNQINMQGTINIVNSEPGTGPGFWIQTDPGISGRIAITPNISSREVMGVVNNGEDLGTVIFNVPPKAAQDFYYNLTEIGPVDLITSLTYDDINNQPLEDFILTYDGIDGITYLDGRTLVFNNDSAPPGIYTITVQTIDSVETMIVGKTDNINALEKFYVRYGVEYSNTGWYYTQNLGLTPIPVMSAVQDTLYYQDGTDPEIFGIIKLIDLAETETLDVLDIIGQKQYTSPNGVVFSNGLKVKFTGDVYPPSYGSGITEITCLTTSANTNLISCTTTTGLYAGQSVTFDTPTIGNIESNRTYYIAEVINSYQFSIATAIGGDALDLTTDSGTMTGNSLTTREYYVSGVGTAIELLPVQNFITPEVYIVDENDSTVAIEPRDPDYLTIDRASIDQNPWSRSNRWFHVDIINATASYNNTPAVIDFTARAKRPIIQFQPNLKLYNMGTQGKQPVEVIDFSQTDALSNVEGATSYAVDGYYLVNGSRVIFAADEDTAVRNKIYVVQFIVPDSTPPLPSPYAGPEPVIHLVPATDAEVLANQCTYCLAGDTEVGKTFWYDGVEWFEAQQKTSIQQAPLFDIFDSAGISLSNRSVYPSSNFTGTKLFSYAIGTNSLLDEVLQIPLQYLNLANVGDIVFDNNLYKDTFTYTRDNVSVTVPISLGFVYQYLDRTNYQRQIGWQTAITTTQVYQQFSFTYSSNNLELDIKVKTDAAVPALKIYVGSKFIESSKYSFVTTDNSTVITLTNDYVPGDAIEVLALSDQTSQVAFYQVPVNLENNPLNGNSEQFTLGTIRQQYQTICENLKTLSGPVNGSNNTRDLGNIGIYGLNILQQSAPLTMAGYFLRSDAYNVFASIDYNNQEYIKYKNQILHAVTQQTIQFQTPAEILDTAVESVTLGKVESQPFYWSDMLPSGAVYTENSYTVGINTITTFDTIQVYNYTSANYLGMNVYLNGSILTRGLDYTVATDGPTITVLVPLAAGDTVTIREYAATYGNFVPNTPTKVGLYPAFQPRVLIQKTSTGTQTVIVGHDGSLTKTFGDIRDEVLLEFETRIYNNLKLDGNPVPLTQYDVIPGQFRDTGYSFSEINNILSQDLLKYVAWNKLAYQDQDFNQANAFTWNYSEATNRLDNKNLLGAWRGIYRYFYDTQQPEVTPWEMFGFSVKPAWWDEVYSAGPYTADNLVLWEDAEAGYVRDPSGGYFLPEFARPGLTKVIPTGSEGTLLAPLDSVVSNYDIAQVRKSWAIGDGGPVEASWWNSSSYPFAVMRLLAVTRPAKFFALFADRDLYRYQDEFEQYLYNGRYRLDANGVEVYGNGVSKASYINWIVDFNRQSGFDSTADLTADLQNLDVRLCYRMASFSDKQYIKIYTEKSSPNSTNTSFLIPDESYNLLLYKNQCFDRASYSSVIVQQVPGGYSVTGYSTTQPYFNILTSVPTGKLQTFTVGEVTVRVPTLYTNTVTPVPYGFIFSNQTAVADFLLSYGQFLASQGLTFTSRANGYTLNWAQMVNEFLYWSQQGWEDNALINLNPLAFELSVTKPDAIVDNIFTQTADNILMDQNRQELPTRSLNVVRIGNTFSVAPLNTQTLSFIDLKYTSYEHMIVLDNASLFGDLIYDSVTGARQARLKLVCVNTTDWNGSVNAPGFILNQDNVEEWSGLKTYTKGQIVRYKNVYWSALTIVQPSASFDFNDWVQSDYTQIELGLLPNLSNKADQLANSYNINSANIETDNDLLSYGLIGFRPRQYMAALNLDDVSQVNIYRQFLGSKGTLLSAELFSQADLGKEQGNYDIYENWAVQRAVYGANANRSFFELRLNRSLLNANPSLIQVIVPEESSQADQTILLSDIWRQSYKLTSPNILPETFDVPTDTALPTAGYVNLEDVDITVFDLDNAANLGANLNKIANGTSVWVARVNDYDWNIYQTASIPGTITHVCDNLDGTSRVIFSQQHGLSKNDRLIIRFFDQQIDGVYDVLSILNLTTITINYRIFGTRTVIEGNGIGFTLQTMRVSQASDIVDLPYANSIVPGARVWVDDTGQGHWAVLQKQQVFSGSQKIAPIVLDANELYGGSLAQSSGRYALLVGSPKYGFGSGTETGAVYVYVIDPQDQYAPISVNNESDSVLTLDVPGVRGYGNAMAFGSKTWAVAGASKSLGSASQANNGYICVIYRDPGISDPNQNPYVQWQLLTTPGSVSVDQGEFGYAVAISQDERWMYVSAPAINKVYAYGRVDWQEQYVRTVGDGFTTTVGIGNAIQVNAATQLIVTVGNTLYQLGVDYTVNGSFTAVNFITVPPQGELIYIRRINSKQLDFGSYYNVSPSATSGIGIGATFTIIRVRGEVGQPGGPAGSTSYFDQGSGYAVSDTITIAAASFDGTNPMTLTVTGVTATGGITSFSIAYTPPALATVFSLNEYLFTVDNIYSFSIEVDGVLQRPNIDYTFNSSTKDVTFLTVPGQGTSIVARAKGYFEYVDTLSTAGLGLDPGARFGQSLSTSTDGRQIMIGAPYQTSNGKTEAGVVYVFDRNVQKFIYGEDPSTVTFTVLGTPVAPVSVIVNNEFYTNQVNGVLNGNNTFTVSGSNITINGSLAVGDVIEIETNQFAYVQTISQNTVADFSNFGSSVALCSYNCSLYSGAPQSSLQIFKGGVVERNVNLARTYGTITSTEVSPSLTAGDTIRINDIDVAVPVAPNNTVQGLANAINAAVPNAMASVANNLLTVTVKNSQAAPTGNKLNVAPGSVGNAYHDLGFDMYAWTQTIVSPYPVAYSAFGSSISIDTSATSLVVGAPKGSQYLETVWDDGITDFDAAATIFYSVIELSGVAYTYDYLASSTLAYSNPGKFVFGDQITDNNLVGFDQFGIAVSYRDGSLVAGAPGNDWDDSSSSNYGAVFVFLNNDQKPAWLPIHVESPTVDIRLLNSIFLYDRVTSAKTEFLDFFNPLQGKILGAAQQNIDYTGAVDPASYNNGPTNIRGTTWGADHVGEVWWDISTVRFIDPNQDDIVYASRRWGQIFPGSSIDVYQWIVSDTPPALYTGPGTPLNTLSYSTNVVLSVDGNFNSEYFFWVKNITDIATQKGKTLSVETVANYIANPKSSGISYLAPIDASTVAIYNSSELIEAQDTILHIEFDRELNNDNVHIEYEIIPQDRADGFLSPNLYRKLLDSFCGVDTFGSKVPDVNLSPAEKYGVQFRPRQSMFVDRFLALQNYIKRVNRVLSLFPISESRSFALLNSSEPEPGSDTGLWNKKVADLEILSFQRLDLVPLGYRYLVESDARLRGLWSIYQVTTDPITSGKTLTLFAVQNYDTQQYWSYINWYRPGYNSSIRPVLEVPNYSALSTLTVPIGSSVKVTANAQGKFEIYLREDLGWTRVGLQDGTIELSAELYDYALGRFGFDLEVFDAQFFDEEPVTETRKILESVNQELFVGDLEIERNRALILMFNFVLSEFSAPEWLVKTSLIDVDHRIRELLPFQNYVRDNQEFVSDYIQEVKPYHTQIREFNLTYDGQDAYLGDLTDFDLPAYWDNAQEVPQFVSPILLPYDHSNNLVINTLSDVPSTSEVWSKWPYSQWYNEYLLELEEIAVVDGGSGYQGAPVVTIVGDAAVPAQAVALVNSIGQVVAINIVDPGSGYRSTPTVEFTSGNGSGARAYARLNNSLVRDIKVTIKYDRFQFNSSILTWSPEGTYQTGTLVRYNNIVWEANPADGSSAVVGPNFNLEDWTRVPAGDLSGVDRTMGYYVPGVNMPGLDLPLLIDGVDYPGVQVWGDYFLGTIPADAQYQSSFTDVTLGETFTSINVDGGEFVDTYEGHAPEELVNGSEYDTLDLRVYTRPGSDWQGDGHGFQIVTKRYIHTPGDPLVWGGLEEHPVNIVVSNATTLVDLTDGVNYTVDWAAQTVSILSGATTGDIINIDVYELGGGSQLFRGNYTAEQAGTSVIIPVNAAEIYTVATFIDGQPVSGVTWLPYVDSSAWNVANSYNRLDIVNNSGIYYRALQDVPAGILLNNTSYWLAFVPTLQSEVFWNTTLSVTDGVAIVAMGYTTPQQYSWSTAVVENFVANDTITGTKTLIVSSSLEGTNPANLVVVQNGLRLRPPGCIEWFGDDTSLEFGLPQNLGYSQILINPLTDVQVWVNNVLQVQSYGAVIGSYSVTNWTGSSTPGRQVLFNTPPAAGDRILISVQTVCDYQVFGNEIQITAPIALNDSFTVTSWNDTSQQNLLTLTWVGTGTTFDLTRPDAEANRLWVTLNGYHLFDGQDFTVSNGYLTLAVPATNPADVLVVTQFAASTVPEAMAFRIFQDMRGVQATYRITESTTTTLVQSLSAGADVIYVADVSKLDQPNPEQNQLGIITIDGERIAYRYRDLVTNSVSGLYRGTAGTAAAAHASGSLVYDMGRGNLMPVDQNYIVSDTFEGDDTTTVFTCENIQVGSFDGSSLYFEETLEVYVGGIRQYSTTPNQFGYVTPCQYPYTASIVTVVVDGENVDVPRVMFYTNNDPVDPVLAPPSGAEITVLQRQGTWWYDVSTAAARELALQESTTTAARFLQGNT